MLLILVLHFFLSLQMITVEVMEENMFLNDFKNIILKWLCLPFFSGLIRKLEISTLIHI